MFMTRRTPPYALHRFHTGPFERTSKRRHGFASESRVKRGQRIVHGDKELIEKLGRNDPCPCGSGRRFQAVLLARWSILTVPRATSTSATSKWARRGGPDAGVAKQVHAPRPERDALLRRTAGSNPAAGT